MNNACEIVTAHNLNCALAHPVKIKHLKVTAHPAQMQRRRRSLIKFLSIFEYIKPLNKICKF